MIISRLVICCSLFMSSVLSAQQAPAIEGEISEDNQLNDSKSLNDVKITTADGFFLSAKYFPGKESASAVMLLHDCYHDSSVYQGLNSLLSGFGVHVLSLDLRGFGASTSQEFSHQDIKRNA